MKGKITAILLLLSMLLISGCQKDGESQYTSGDKKAEKLKVAVSIVPQETFVQAVAGDLVETFALIPPGNSPANYAPSPHEMVKLSNASLYFSLGVPAEEANILPKISDFNKEVKLIKLNEQVAQIYPELYWESDHSQLEEHDQHGVNNGHEELAEHQHTGRDPHIWLSPKRVQIMVEVIAQELSLLDPANEETFQENAKNFINQLKQIDQEIKTTLTNLPKKKFIVYHPAFGYFADDYGLEMVAIEEDGKNTTAQRLQEIIAIAKEEDIRVIFYQAEIDSKQSRVIAEEINGNTELVEPLSPDYLNNLQKMAKTFVGVSSN